MPGSELNYLQGCIAATKVEVNKVRWIVHLPDHGAAEKDISTSFRLKAKFSTLAGKLGNLAD
jgi:hypothetical protein